MPHFFATMSMARSMAKRVGSSPKARAGESADLLVTATFTLMSPIGQS